MPTPRLGDIVPLVTTPPPAISLPWRAMPGPVITNATSFSAVPSARASRTASAPTKPVSSLHAQPSPASIGLRVSSMSLP